MLLLGSFALRKGNYCHVVRTLKQSSGELKPADCQWNLPEVNHLGIRSSGPVNTLTVISWKTPDPEPLG